MTGLLESMLSSKPGSTSSSRALSWLVTGAVVLVWGWVSVSSRTLVDLPNGVLGLVALAIGGYGVGKALEPKKEGDSNG